MLTNRMTQTDQVEEASNETINTENTEVSGAGEPEGGSPDQG